MGYQERNSLIARLEQARSSRVLSYVLSDRETFPQGVPGHSASLHTEPQLYLLRLLDEVGYVDCLDLFLYTRGGATDSVWPFVTALREHTDHLTVLVPFRAHSGGTLICLGADEVVMSAGAELSPIDPTTGNPFNPRDPGNPSNSFGISVEDVVAYFNLAEERAEIRDEPHRTEVFKQLTSQVHPLALGNVQRVYMLIRRLAEKLLLLHLDKKQEGLLERIIEGLTTELYSHTHAVSLREARELLGGWVRTPTDEEGPAMAALFASYAETFQLGSRFNLPEYMADEQVRELHVLGAVLETRESSYAYTTDLNIMQRPNLPQGVQVQVPPGQPIPLVPWVTRAYDYGIVRMGWHENTDGE